MIQVLQRGVLRGEEESTRADDVFCRSMFVWCASGRSQSENRDAGNPHVRFDERGMGNGRCPMALATAPILDLPSRRFVVTRKFGRYWRRSRPERAISPDQLGRNDPLPSLAVHCGTSTASCMTAPRWCCQLSEPLIDRVPLRVLGGLDESRRSTGGVDPRICQNFAAPPGRAGGTPILVWRGSFWGGSGSCMDGLPRPPST